MVYLNTNLIVIDNSGAKKFQMIQVLGNSKNKEGKIGDVVVGSIKKIKAGIKNIKCGIVSKALIVNKKKNLIRKTGFNLKFNQNAVILLDNNYIPRGTRISGVLSKELRILKKIKILSLTRNIL